MKRNYAQPSNYICGTFGDNFGTIEQPDILPFYIQSLNLPGLSLGIPELGARGGAKLHMTSDTADFNNLNVEFIMDEDYTVYRDLVEIVHKHLNVETSKFADYDFNFWIEIKDDMGTSKLKTEYYNCRIQSISDINLDAKDDTTEIVCSVEIAYDYFKVIPDDGSDRPTLRI